MTDEENGSLLTNETGEGPNASMDIKMQEGAPLGSSEANDNTPMNGAANSPKDDSDEDDDDDPLESGDNGESEEDDDGGIDDENDEGDAGSASSKDGEKDEHDEKEDEPIENLQPKDTTINKLPQTKGNRRKRRQDDDASPRKHYYQDCVSIRIPIDCTVSVDLGMALRRTRAKRVVAVERSFPSLVHSKAAVQAGTAALTTLGAAREGEEDVADEADGATKSDLDTSARGDEGGGASSQHPLTKKRRLKNVPRREDFATIVDYLEAKYAQGVMLDDQREREEVGAAGAGKEVEDDDDEGQGSVYSESSFLDDSNLQRDVAEQVLAHSTTTKVELLGHGNDDGDEFFVNVGDLEVEETEMTKEQYDPLLDVDAKDKPRKKRKRTTPSVSGAKASSAAAKGDAANNGKKNGKTAAAKTTDEKPSGSSSTKKKKPLTSPRIKPSSGYKDKNQGKNGSGAKSKSPKSAQASPEVNALRVTADELKAEVDEWAQKVVDVVKTMPEEDLPRRKTKERVSVKCPADKKAGDSIFFANPHFPGQKLKVKIPKTCGPGGSFKVTVPVADPSKSADGRDDDDLVVDHNKWGREFYDAINDYALKFDDWVDAVANCRAAEAKIGIGSSSEEFASHLEKRKKWDSLVDDMPNNLKTPLDKVYLQKILRRARQNKHKREMTAKRNKKKGAAGSEGDDTPSKEDDKKAAASTSKSKSSTAKEEATPPPAPEEVRVVVPQLSKEFSSLQFDASDF